MMVEKVIEECLEDIQKKKINERVKEYKTYGNPYALLKDEIVVCVRRKKDGTVIEIDVTDLLKNLF